MNKARLALSERFLAKLCKPEYMEEIIGDLHEYEDELQMRSPWKRWVFFWFHVLNFLQPWALKSLGGTQKLNQYGMFKNHFKTSYRSLKKNWLFSLVNVSGLSISMSVGVLMILLINEINSFDRFHKNEDRLYRITTNKVLFGQEMDMGSSSFLVANEAAKRIPGIEQSVIIRDGVSANIRVGDDIVRLTGLYSTARFFEVFSFELIQGNPQTALDGPNKMILTESTAKKLFGEDNPIGKSLEFESNGGWQTRQIAALVTGVVQGPPKNSHMQFEALVSMQTYDQPAISGSGWNPTYRTDPTDFQNNYAYLLLDENTDKEEVEAGLVSIVADFNATEDHPVTHLLQPLNTMITSDRYENDLGPRFSQRQLNIMGVLTIIVLLSACFNYTNLSLGRALRRSKEVGVRKVVGARRSQLFMQFVVEAVMLSMAALLIGVILFFLIKPAFLQMPNPASSGHNMFALDIGLSEFLYFFLFALLVGTIAGFLPALFLSKLKTTVVFKDVTQVKLLAGLNLRKVLSVLQFALSIGLIMCAVVVNKQYHFAINYDIGLDTENIVNVKIQGDYLDLLENEYAQIPGVITTTRSMMSMGTGHAELMIAQNEEKTEESMFFWNSIDHKYMDIHGLELLAGTGFAKPLADSASRDKIIVNEYMLNTMGLGTPEEAIGKFLDVRGFWRAKLQVVGVVKNFINTSINTLGQGEIMMNKNFAFMQALPNQSDGILEVKFRTDDLVGLLSSLEAGYKKHDPLNPFIAEFYADEIAEVYESQKTLFTLISFLSFLAISISLLGLLGMAVFSTESRIKEISIRKVLGAGVKQLMFLLSRGFLLIIVLAGLIAIPAAYYILDTRLLTEFEYRTSIGLFEMASGFVIVLIIAVLTISWQIRQAASRNPAGLLRNE